jgi:hypothetical protein
MKKIALVLSISVLAGCVTPHEEVTTEKKHGVTVIHHRSHRTNGTVDRIEAIDSRGVVTQAEVHVYDVGRLPDGHGGMHEAHKFYKVIQDSYPNLRLPKKVTAGPRTVYTSPTYSPPPRDQRINDAVASAKEAKEKLDKATEDVQKRLAEDNNLRGELQIQSDKIQELQDQLNAAMNTPSHKPQPPTEAQKAADDAVKLSVWGNP